MRVVLDVTSCAKPQRGGIGNYGWRTLEAMGRLAPDNKYVLAVRPNRLRNLMLLKGLLPGAPRRLMVDPLPWLLGKVDVFQGVGVRLPSGGAFPKVVMMHDLNVFEFPELASDEWRTKRQARIVQTLERADIALSLSEQGAAALVEHTGFPRERIRVIPHGVDTDTFCPAEPTEVATLRRRLELDDRPYVVCMGPWGPRKNQAGLLAAMVAADLPDEWLLVLAGPRGEAADAARAGAVAAGFPESRLRLPGWVPDEDLPALLADAGIYVCASRHEGFGLPVLEAQACGAPVVCSNRGALPETLGDCGLAFDPDDTGEFAAALRRMAGDETLRANLAARGPERVRGHYTWERVARDHLAVYKELLPRR